MSTNIGVTPLSILRTMLHPAKAREAMERNEPSLMFRHMLFWKARYEQVTGSTDNELKYMGTDPNTGDAIYALKSEYPHAQAD